MAAHRYWKVVLTDISADYSLLRLTELEPKIGGTYNSMNNSFLPHPYGWLWTMNQALTLTNSQISEGQSPAGPFSKISDGQLSGFEPVSSNFYSYRNDASGNPVGHVTTYLDFTVPVDIEGFRVALDLVYSGSFYYSVPQKVQIHYSDAINLGDIESSSFTLAQEFTTVVEDWADETFKNFDLAPVNFGPTATNLSITGSTVIGNLLIGNYTYADADNDLEGVSTFRWLRNGSPIGGATSITYTTTQADVGNLITFEVTPVALTGAPATGPATSTGVYVTNAAVSVPKNLKMKNGVFRAVPTPAEFTLYSGNIVSPSDSFIRIKAGSAITLNATTPIESGAFIGQEILLENSYHGFPANTITIPSGGNVKMSGGTSMVLAVGSTLRVIWDGTYWVELSRSTNS